MRTLLSLILFSSTLVLPFTARSADSPDTTPVSTLVDFTGIATGDENLVTTNIDVNNATIASVANAKQLILTFFQDAKIATGNSDFSCIIHVIRWGTDSETGKPTVTKSNWYVYNPQNTWTNQDFISNKRIYGIRNPYILAIHLNVPLGDLNDYHLAYKYTAVHRLPANIQNLVSAIDLFKPAARTKDEKAPLGMWAIGTLEGNPPSDITLTSAISRKVTGAVMNLESSNSKFDDEGLYRWDISIGVPIVSYKQLQSIVDSTGQINQANIDKRNLLVLGNLFLKPVDVKGSSFLTVPHLVGGISIASKPLHNAMAGIGWGPVLTNFFVGAMILTENLPNHKLAHHYKLAFGLNLPMRTLAAKLGLKSQIE